MRAGGYTLTLVSSPRIFLILSALADGAQTRQDLRCAAGFPAQSTLRSQLGLLEDLGAMSRSRPDDFPGAFEYSLSDAGEELLKVVASLEHWLAGAPNGPLALGQDAGRIAVRGLVDGWEARMLAPLAEQPASLTELDKQLTTASYPTLERRIDTMRLAEQLEEGNRTRVGTRYRLTTWLRRGLAPLAAAARWECHSGPEEAERVGRREVESAFKIAAPLLRLPSRLSGTCQLAVRYEGRGSRERDLGLVEIAQGEVAFGPVDPRQRPDAWASGSAEDWFGAAFDRDMTRLRLNGDRRVARELLEQIHIVLNPETQLASDFPIKTD